MGQVGDGSVVAPFANEAMRLLREDWKGKYGSKMLAEELFPILQTGIPNPDQNFQNFITINAGDTGSFAQLIDKFGNKLFEITAADGLKPIEPPGYPPVKLKPRIVWGLKTIVAGGSIGAGELDAVAVDPETGAEVPGVYVYSPPDGTTFASAGTATLYVNFTPTDGVKYRRAMGSTVLTITGAVVKKTPALVWPGPPEGFFGGGGDGRNDSIDTVVGGRVLDSAILNCIALDPDTLDPITGSFVYTPPAGGSPMTGGGADVPLHVEFTPDDLANYEVTSIDASLRVFTIAPFGGDTVQIGNLIVVTVAVVNNDTDAEPTATTVAVSDSMGNTYTQVGSYRSVWHQYNIVGPPPHGTTKTTLSMWRTLAGSDGTATVTATPSTGSATVVERANCKRVDQSSPFDSEANNTVDPVTSNPEIFTTTTIGFSGSATAPNAFFGSFAGVDGGGASTSYASQFTGTASLHGAATALTQSRATVLTAPAEAYVAIGASFKQRPSI